MARIGGRLLAAFAAITSLSACLDQGSTVSRADTALSGALSTSSAPADADGPRERRMTVYLTGYSYWDNTPPGSAAISKPVVHRKAGGTGTFDDPVTIAVGHVIEGGRQTLDYPPGTRFYIERLKKYAIVEDVCGDGSNPQDGPCHSGYNGLPWLDLYIGGSEANSRITTSCAREITAVQPIVIHPAPDYPVLAGDVVESHCNAG